MIMTKANKESVAVRETTLLIATTLQEAEQPFGVCMASLAVVMAEIALELDIDFENLASSMEMTYNVLRKKHEEDKLTGGDYVQ
jgi:hypothetical protein